MDYYIGLNVGPIEWVWHCQPLHFFNAILNSAGSILFQSFFTAYIAVQKRWLSVQLGNPNSACADKFYLLWSQHSLHVNFNIHNVNFVSLLKLGTCKQSQVDNSKTNSEVVLTHIWKQKSKTWVQLNPTTKPLPLRNAQPKSQITIKKNVWCAEGKKIILRPPITTQSNEGSKFLQEMGLSIQEQCQTWDLIWERGKPRKISCFLWKMLTNNLENCPRSRNDKKCSRCTMCNFHAVITTRHCLWDCSRAKIIWSRMLRLRQHLGICEPLKWRRVFLGSTKVLEIHKLLKMRVREANSLQRYDQIHIQLERAAPTYLWELTRAFSLWHIWTARCDFTCHQRECPVNFVVIRIWNELLTSAQLLHKEIIDKTNILQSELKQELNDVFWCCYHFQNTLFKKDSKGNVQWVLEPPIWLLQE